MTWYLWVLAGVGYVVAGNVTVLIVGALEPVLIDDDPMSVGVIAVFWPVTVLIMGLAGMFWLVTLPARWLAKRWGK